ncbi:MAG: glycosyltransferase [Nanoarchaeota archaeon]
MFTTFSIWIMYFFSLYFVLFWFLVFLDKGVKEKSNKLKNFPSVTVAIPVYNGQEAIAKTINSVLNLNYPKEKLQLIIVNDGSKDNTKKIVEKIIKKHKKSNILLINQQNQGKGAALNTALKNTKSKFFVSLDADSFVREDALQKLIPCFKNEKTAAVLPLVKLDNRKSIIEKIQSCEYLINFFYKRVMSNMDCIHVAPGPFSVYKTEIIKKLKGFDENNLTEDMEITLRLQKHHYQITQILSAEILTIAPKTFKEFYKQRNRWYKGTIFNMIKYKEMLFNPKYGELGVFFLPTVLLSAIFSVLSVYLLYTLIFRPLFNWLYDISFIHFNLIPIINNGLSSFTFLDINLSNLFFAVTIFALVIIWLVFSYKHTNEKVKTYTAFYIFLYPSIMAIIWLGVLFDLIRGKKQKW